MGKNQWTFADRVALAVGAIGLLLACQFNAGGGDGKARVECEGQNDGVDCVVTHTEGSSKLKVCWDLKFECANGIIAQASACQSVSPGAKAQRKIPPAQVSNWSKCDKAVSTTADNLKITAE